MNSPSRYIRFVQEAAYKKLAIANQTPEKILLPEFFEAALLHLFFFSAFSYGDDPYLKSLPLSRRRLLFPAFSLRAYIVGFFCFINLFFFSNLFHSFPKAHLVYRFVFLLSIEILYQTRAKQPFLTSKKFRSPHHSRKTHLNQLRFKKFLFSP